MSGIFGPDPKPEPLPEPEKPIEQRIMQQVAAVPVPQAQAQVQVGKVASIRDFEPQGAALEAMTGIRQKG